MKRVLATSPLAICFAVLAQVNVIGFAHASCVHAISALEEQHQNIVQIPVKANPELFAPELDSYLGLSFMATSNNPSIEHSVYVETAETIVLSKSFGERVAFRASFQVGPTNKLVTRAFSAFDLVVVSSGTSVHGASLKPEQSEFKITKLYFSKDEDLSIKNGKVEMLPIYSCEDLLSARVGTMNLATFLFFRGSRPLSSYDPKDVEEISHILESGLRNLLNPKIQNQVVEIILQGPEALEKNLFEIGFKFGATVYGHVPQKAWAHIMGQKKLYDKRSALGLYPIMVEGGSFAESHGAYAHHAQLLAFFWGMNAQDRGFFIETLMEKQRSEHAKDWYSWVTLFDSDNTSSPNTAFFWHEKIMEAQSAEKQ